MMYDLLIIGSGLAGISVALSSKARNLDLLWFGSRDLRAKIEKAERVMNYPGFSAVTGQEMQNAFLGQIDEVGIMLQEMRIDSVVNHVGYSSAICFAAGDCTGRPYQYTKAVGEDNVALHSAIDYLSAKKKEAVSE